jgi:hypothetical protein
MPFIAGESVRQRLTRETHLPIAEALASPLSSHAA